MSKEALKWATSGHGQLKEMKPQQRTLTTIIIIM